MKMKLDYAKSIRIKVQIITVIMIKNYVVLIVLSNPKNQKNI